MKHIQIRFTTVVMLLLVLVLTTAAAPPKGTSLYLVETRNDPSGGVMFVFEANGQFSDSQLKGTVHVQGEHANYDLNCSQVSDTRVQCSTSRKTTGMNVVINLAGFIFWTNVPEARPLPPPPQPVCYANALFMNNCPLFKED